MSGYEYSEDVEQWRPVPGFSHYEVSDHGRVRSTFLDMTRGRRGKEPVYYRTLTTHGGYYYISLKRDDGSGYDGRKVHVFVMLAFVGPRPAGKPHIRHLNGVGTDNRLSNLAYGTAAENSADTIQHGMSYATKRWGEQTRCQRGHLYQGANCRSVGVSKNQRVFRECRACSQGNVAVAQKRKAKKVKFSTVEFEADKIYRRLLQAGTVVDPEYDGFRVAC